MRGTGVVARCGGDGYAEVRVRRMSSCGKACESCGGCAAPEEIISVSAQNAINAPEGSRVVIESGSGRTLGLAALVYLAPIVLFFIGWAFHPIAGVAGLAAGIGAVIITGRTLKKRGGLPVSIVALADERDG